MAAYLQASAKAALPPGSSAPPAALSDFATTSGLAAVFGALNLSVDVHEQCLARTVQWFQAIGVRSRNVNSTLQRWTQWLEQAHQRGYLSHAQLGGAAMATR